MISDPYRILTLASSGFFLTALRLVFSIVLCLFIVDLVHNIDDNHSSRIVNIALSIIVYFLDSWTSARWQRRNTLALYAVGPWFEPPLHLTFSWYCFWSSFKRLLTSYVLCGFLLHFSMDFSLSDAVYVHVSPQVSPPKFFPSNFWCLFRPGSGFHTTRGS